MRVERQVAPLELARAQNVLVELHQSSGSVFVLMKHRCATAGARLASSSSRLENGRRERRGNALVAACRQVQTIVRELGVVQVDESAEVDVTHIPISAEL